MNWLKRLFHHHEWEIIASGRVVSAWDGRAMGTWYDQKCSVCGKLRCIELELE